tara:strand:+ start:28 stop:831 length:804 start_codon:yes stop_codon:yes gene_type:complete
MAENKENKGTGELPPFEVFDDIPLDLKDTIIKNLPKLSPDGAETGMFDDYMKSKLQLRKFEMEQEEAAQAEKDRIANMSVFGKMMEKLKTDADARQKFFDQLGGIGAEISRPTEPGEARSLVRDVIVGSERGEGKSIAKRKAAAEQLANVALARQRANPMQYYTTAMKELTQQAIAAGYEPGTSQFTKYIGAALRSKGLSENLASYSETLKNLNEQLLTAQALPNNEETVQQIIKQISDIQNLINVELGGTSTTSSNTIDYKDVKNK